MGAVVLGVLVGAGRSATAQPPRAPLTAPAAYDTVQRLRTNAERRWRQGDRSALDSLHLALEFLGRPDVRDLAQGWPYLNARAPNVWYDAAQYHAQAGETDLALAALEELVRSGGNASYLDLLARDTLLRPLADLPRFRRVVRALAVERRMWDDSAFVSRYTPDLSLDQRLAGLAQLWAEVRWGYPDFKLTPELDWDSLFIAYLPRVRAAEGTYAYYQVLQEFVAQLRDAHTNVYFPQEVYDTWGVPPIRTGLVEDRVLVLDVMSPTVEALGVHAGQEVEAVDGIPVTEYAATRITPYQSSSTPQDLAVRSYTYALLWGAEGEPVRLTLRAGDGVRRDVAVRRSGYLDRRSQPLVRDTMLPGDIGYLRVDEFQRDSVVRLMRQGIQRLLRARGLVIDVRHNDGGISGIGYALLAMLAGEPFLTSAARVRSYSGYYRVYGFDPLQTVLRARAVNPDTSLHYGGPVVVLAGPETFSAAEDFLVAYRQMERGPIIGEPSGGNSGQPLFFRMPGGGSARVRTKHDAFADGREFTAIGIQPDVLVRPTIAGVRAGRDEALEAALRHLREGRR